MKKLPLFVFLIIYITVFAQDGPPAEIDLNTNPTNENFLSFNSKNTNQSIVINTSNTQSLTKNSSVKEFTSEILKQRLESLNQKTPFNVEYNATVERFIRLYLKTRKDDFSNLMDKAKYYFPIFEEHLDKYNLPLEIKYLAVVESALKPTSRSSAGAKGLWQFMYHTGKEYGLNITSYIDERSDPIKATEAACKYLENLYKRFNDWDLALAAYNSGPGNVSKAIRRSGGLRNYWNIRKYLPAETRGYLPAFYTTFYLFEYGAEHNIYPKNMRITFFDTDTIHVKRKVTFKKIQDEIGVDRALLQELNPQYKLGIIPAHENKNVLVIPKTLLEKFISNEHKIYNLPKKREASRHLTPTKVNSYIVQKGDNLTRIARKFDISPLQLKNWNGLQTNYIIAGQSIVVTPNNIRDKNDSQKNINSKKKTKAGQVFKIYKVKEGESLFIISKKFPNVSINQIRSWNNLWSTSYLKPGTQLKILTNTL